jgi:long-chain acyl-CoA synthetase
MPREEIHKRIEHTLQEVNNQVTNFEKISAVVILSEPWEVSNGILTPTLKIKRDRLMQLFGPKMEAWSKSDQTVIWH